MNAAFFYVLLNRMQQRSLQKKAKERKERRVLFKRMQERCVLLKRTHAQPWIPDIEEKKPDIRPAGYLVHP